MPTVPGYELLRRLGGGPLTRVFAARHAADGGACAVKVLRDEWDGDPAAVTLLRREARAGLAVRHRHLTRLFDAHVRTPPYFLVFELLDGESLRDRLGRDYSLPLREGLRLTRQAAEALAAVHHAGFLHGDIKPDNVRVTEAGSAVLMDLGFSRRPSEHSGAALGTADFMAPEVCRGEVAGYAADWFSFGLLLCATLAGQLPYPPGDLKTTLWRHALDDPRPAVRAWREPWPPRLAALVEGLLAPAPGERPLGPMVVQELIALEIATLGRRAA